MKFLVVGLCLVSTIYAATIPDKTSNYDEGIAYDFDDMEFGISVPEPNILDTRSRRALIDADGTVIEPEKLSVSKYFKILSYLYTAFEVGVPLVKKWKKTLEELNDNPDELVRFAVKVRKEMKDAGLVESVNKDETYKMTEEEIVKFLYRLLVDDPKKNSTETNVKEPESNKPFILDMVLTMKKFFDQLGIKV